jgi:polyvinyl alcohol dehydrogenase (cytochrome)
LVLESFREQIRVTSLPVALAASLAGAVAAPPAAGDWPMYGHDLANTRSGGKAGPSTTQVVSLAQTWRFNTRKGDITGTPVLAGGTLVVGSNGGWVFALNSVTGKLRWSHRVDGPVNGSAAIVANPRVRGGGLVYVAAAKPGRPYLVALRLRTGKLAWNAVLTRQARSDTFGSPVVWRRTVYIGTSGYFGEFTDPGGHARGSVVALNARTGKRRWRTFTVPRHHDGGGVWSTPAIDTRTGRLFVGTGNAYHAPAAKTTDSVLLLNARTGKILRHFQATPNDVWTLADPNGPDADFGASPNLFRDAKGRALVGEGQKSGIYWALDRRTLKPVWHTQVGPGASSGGITGSTAYDGTRIYGPNTAGHLIWALDRVGTLKWVSNQTGPLDFGAVTVANGVVYVTDFSGVVTARDAATGVPLAQLPIGSPSFGGVAVVRRAVYAAVGTSSSPNGGSVVAFGDTSMTPANRGR